MGNCTSIQVDLSRPVVDASMLALSRSILTSRDLMTIKCKPFLDKYSFEENAAPIYSGLNGEVLKTTFKATTAERAVKIMNKKKRDEETLRKQMNIFRQLNHPNIIKIYEVLEDEDNYYMISELYTGSDLLTYIEKKKHISEKSVAKIIKEVVSAIAHMHSRGVVHRNIKPDSIKFETDQESSSIILVNFSFSEKYDSCSPMSGQVGTLQYCAPEMIDELYTDLVDVWACGVMFYLLISGHLPFVGKNDKELKKAIKEKEITFKGPEWDSVSPDVKDLISKMLEKDFSKRISAEAALSHPCFTSDLNENHLDSELMWTVLERLKQYNKKSRVQSAIWVFVADHVFYEKQKKELIQAFKQLDKDHNGLLTKEEIKEGFKIFHKSLPEEEEDVLDKIFSQLDRSKIGKIDYSAFATIVMDPELIYSENNLKTAFDLIDANSDGQISVGELRQVFGSELDLLEDTFWTNMIKEADANKDGMIDFKEFENVVLASRQSKVVKPHVFNCCFES